VDGADLIDEAIWKALVSPVHPNGYGFGARRLRGTKLEDLEEGILTLRVYRILNCLETWYGLTITPVKITIQELQGEIKVDLVFEVGEEKEVHV
jgi:hypothetical protein